MEGKRPIKTNRKQENVNRNIHRSHGTQPCLTQWNYEPCHVGPPKTDASWWRVTTKCGPLERWMVNHFSILALRTLWTVWKGKKIWHWKMNSPSAQNATAEEWRNNSRKNEQMEPKQKRSPGVDVTGDGSKLWCGKEQYCIGTWNVSAWRTMDRCSWHCTGGSDQDHP